MADNPKKAVDGKKPGATKPPAGPDVTLSQLQLEEVLTLLHQALCSHSEAEGVIASAKEGEDASLQARKVLREIFLGTGATATLRALQDAIKELKEPVDKLAHNLTKVLNDKSADLVRALMPAGHFLRRLEDHRVEKEELGAHVAATFFGETPVRAFIQASTTAVYLGQALARTPMASTTLLYTNSIAFPLTVLGDHARHSVYCFCANASDSYCGGWLFHREDEETASELVKLFKRAKHPLTMSFVMPRATTMDDGVFYPSADAANFARLLMLNASQIVLLTTADRLYERETNLPAENHWQRPFDLNRSWDDLAGKTTVVIGGNRADLDIPDFARRLAAKGVNVWLRSPASRGWQLTEGKPAIGQGL